MSTLQITLLRHAKSDWNSPTRDDFDRPLNARGLRDAPVMGRRLRARELQPQRILSSPALRTITTAQIVASELGLDPDAIETDRNLYLATPAAILQVLCERGAGYTNLMIVGHNPGLTELASRIGNCRIDNVPTCGAVAIELHAGSWDAFSRRAGKLLWFDFPKNPETPSAAC